MQTPCSRATARLQIGILMIWLGSSGCGSNAEKFYVVKGPITLNGQPLKSGGGAVVFIADTAWT
jgi:hypothetical protein